MGLFSKKKSRRRRLCLTQTRQAGQTAFDDYKSMYSFHGDISLYKTLRESVPGDAGISWQGSSAAEVRCDDSFAQRRFEISFRMWLSTAAQGA